MKRLLIFVCLLWVFTGCKKHSDDTKPTTSPDTSKIVLQNNVHILDSTKYILNPNINLLTNGIYQYTTSGNTPDYKTGDVIIGITGDGYIRKITGVSNAGNTLTLTTIQGNMTDVIKNGELKFNIPTSSLVPFNTTKPVTNLGLQKATTDFNGLIFAQAGLSVSGSYSFDPNPVIDAQYANGTLTSCNVGFQNAVLTGNLKLVINGAAGANFSGNSVIKTLTDRRLFLFGDFPVLVKTTYTLTAIYSVNIGSNSSKEVDLSSSNSVSLNLMYDGSQWTYGQNFTTNLNWSILPSKQNSNIKVDFSLVPGIAFEFYGIGGPYVNVGINTTSTGNLTTPALDWDLTADGWLSATFGANASVLGYAINFGQQTYSTSHITYKLPTSIAKFSGDLQNGDVGSKLPQPIKVLISDSQNNPVPYVPVYFTVTSGGGLVDSSKVFTDVNGYAKTYWTLGSSFDPQKVQAVAKRGDETSLQNAPVEFTANSSIKIGDHAFGGIVFFLDATQKHGLVVDSVDLASNLTISRPDWNLQNLSGAILPSDTLDLYDGYDDTQEMIINNSTDKAIALLCTNYRGGNYNDWFLPSFQKLLILYSVRSVVHMPNIGYYWSSSWVIVPFTKLTTDTPYPDPILINFIDGSQSPNPFPYYNPNPPSPILTGNVRAIRAF